MLAVLKEMLVLPNTPLSLISQLVQRLVRILHDDQQRITTVCVCVCLLVIKLNKSLHSDVTLPNISSKFVLSKMFLHNEQIAEIISDVREPIMPVSQTEDENEKRKRQVRVSLYISDALYCTPNTNCLLRYVD